MDVLAHDIMRYEMLSEQDEYKALASVLQGNESEDLSLNCSKYNCNRYPNYRLLMTSLNQRTLELNQKRKKETKDT